LSFQGDDPTFKPQDGDGKSFPVDGDTVTCDYVMLDSNRSRLASSYYHKKLLNFVIGQEEVIPGVESKLLQVSMIVVAKFTYLNFR
jgi:FKBP-type peptidyl-prolyl cis-trans isomerase (trigger factor)